jgi:hypothetical protein
MRKVREDRKPCFCSRYHFPHRRGSGRCGSIEKFWDYMYGPDWRVDRDEREAIMNEGPAEARSDGSYDLADVPF